MTTTIKTPKKQVHPITDKQEQFAQLVAHGSTQSDAYRQVYGGKKVEKQTWIAASALARTDKVAARIKELKQENASLGLWTREIAVKKLIDITDKAPANVKVSAIKELNLMHGFDKPGGGGNGATLTDVLNAIANRLPV